jgi:hypothetical protein
MSIYLSGAFTFSVLHLNDRTYILIGDQHYSQKGSCPYDCSDEIGEIEKLRKYEKSGELEEVSKEEDEKVNKIISEIQEETQERIPCLTITGLIKYIIEVARERNEFVDVFFELEYDKSANLHRLFGPSENIKELLFKPIINFEDCLFKKQCPYENARFHYADLRRSVDSKCHTAFLLSYVTVNLSFRLNHENLSNENVYENMNLHKRIILASVITELLLNEKYYLANTNLYKYYEMCLTSDNFLEDFREWFQSIKENLMSIIMEKTKHLEIEKIEKVRRSLYNRILKLMDCFENSNLVVKRYGKVMHRIRTQLSDLDPKLAKQITTYTLGKILNEPLIEKKNKMKVLFEKWVSYYETRDREFLKKIDVYIPHFGESYLMDAYVLGRMFREFDFRSTFIIVHAGFSHTRNIEKFLIKKGASSKRYKNIEGLMRCFEIPLTFLESS